MARVHHATIPLREGRAQMQRFATSLDAHWSSDWESRYVSGGVSELEDHANA